MLQGVGVAQLSLPNNLLLCPGNAGKDIATCQLHMGMGREVFVVSVYFDITINQVPPELTKLLEDKQGLRAKGQDIIKWYSHYLTTSFVKVSLEKTTRCCSLTREKPQGDLLPTFLDIVFYRILIGFVRIPGI